MAGNSGRRITIQFLGNAQGLQDAADDGAGALDGLGKKLGGFAKVAAGALAAAGLAGGAALVSGLMTGMQNEKTVDRAAAALGLSPEESAELGRISGSLYSQAYGESMGEVTEAVEAVKSSFRDLSGAELETVSRQALDFAGIFQTEVPTAVSAAQTAVKNGLAGSATEALDLMTAALQRVPAALRENVVDAVAEYSPYLADLGFSGEQAFALIAAGAANGEVGIDKVGDSLKEFQIRATDMSTASVDAYEAMGLSAGDMADRLLAGGDTAAGAMAEIVDGLLAIEDPTKRANSAIALFGTPLEDMSVAQIPQFLTALDEGTAGLGDFEGAIDRAGETANDNAATNFEAFKRQLSQTFVDTLGGKVLPKLNEWSAIVSEKAGPAMDRMRDAFEQAQPKIREIGDTIVDLWTRAQPALQQTADWAVRVFGDIKAIVTDAVTIVQALWDRFGDNILNSATATFENLKTTLEGAFTYIRGIFQIFSSLLKGDWSGMWEGIKTAASGAWQMIVGLFRQAGNLVATAVRTLASAVTGIFSGLWSGVTSLVSRGIDNVVGAIRSAPAKISALAGAFMNAGRGIINSLLSGLSNAGDFVSDLAGNVWTGIKRLLNSAIGRINDALNITIDPPGPLGPWTFDLGMIPRFEKGTNHAPGGLALVGEAGPELVHLPRGSRVTPNHDLMGSLRGVGSGGIVINISGALDPIAVGRQVEKILATYSKTTGRPIQVRTA